MIADAFTKFATTEVISVLHRAMSLSQLPEYKTPSQAHRAQLSRKKSGKPVRAPKALVACTLLQTAFSLSVTLFPPPVDQVVNLSTLAGTEYHYGGETC